MWPTSNQKNIELDIDEETQLAIALSLSAAEASSSKPPPPRRLPPPQQNSLSADEQLAKQLQHQFDQETPSPAVPLKKNNTPSISQTPPNILIDPSCCAGCHQPLTPSIKGFFSLASQSTRYLTALGRSWHPGCFKCAGCRQPLGGQFSVTEGQPWHPECHKKSYHPCCCVCYDFLPELAGNRIVWHSTPFWGDKFCPSHSPSKDGSSSGDGTKRCTACHRLQPRNDQWADLDDGRTLCLLCLGSVVPNTASAEPLYANILAFYHIMSMPLPRKPPLSLVDNSALNSATSRQGPREDGPIFHTRGLCLTEYSQSMYTTTISRPSFFSSAALPATKHVRLGEKQCSVTAILVLAGLPRLLTGCILAHECMHAWLRLSGYEDLPLEVEEGLCQLMALLWLEAQQLDGGSYEERLGAFLGHEIRTDPSFVYGDGLRAALEAFQKHGLATVLAHVRRARKLPS